MSAHCNFPYCKNIEHEELVCKTCDQKVIGNEVRYIIPIVTNKW